MQSQQGERDPGGALRTPGQQPGPTVAAIAVRADEDAPASRGGRAPLRWEQPAERERRENSTGSAIEDITGEVRLDALVVDQLDEAFRFRQQFRFVQHRGNPHEPVDHRSDPAPSGALRMRNAVSDDRTSFGGTSVKFTTLEVEIEPKACAQPATLSQEGSWRIRAPSFSPALVTLVHNDCRHYEEDRQSHCEHYHQGHGYDPFTRTFAFQCTTWPRNPEVTGG